MKCLLILLIPLIYLLLVTNIVYGVTTTITNKPQTISSLDPFIVDITISGASAGDNYLKLELYKPSTSNYFGETFNGSQWYKDNDYLKYYKITISTGNNWTGQVQVRIGDPISETISDSLKPTSISYSNVFLSEVMPNPDQNSNEWIEIFNANDFEIYLNKWYINDVENLGSNPREFNLIISQKKFATIDLTTSMFNNNGDSVRLLDFDKLEKDSIQYQDSERGSTIGRVNFDEDIYCIQNPSKGEANNPCLYPQVISEDIVNTATPKPSLFPSITNSFQNYITTKPLITHTNLISIRSNTINPTPTGKEKQLDVLGIAKTNNIHRLNYYFPLLYSLLFASFSYSLLIIGSVLTKLKRVF